MSRKKRSRSRRKAAAAARKHRPSEGSPPKPRTLFSRWRSWQQNTAARLAGQVKPLPPEHERVDGIPCLPDIRAVAVYLEHLGAKRDDARSIALAVSPAWAVRRGTWSLDEPEPIRLMKWILGHLDVRDVRTILRSWVALVERRLPRGSEGAAALRAALERSPGDARWGRAMENLLLRDIEPEGAPPCDSPEWAVWEAVAGLMRTDADKLHGRLYDILSHLLWAMPGKDRARALSALWHAVARLEPWQARDLSPLPSSE